MVAMDPDSEFSALTALYQSVVSDMKGSYGAWEMVALRAQKLATQLRSTAAALSSFNDAVQTVSDLANNLKGASRDAGACVTRLCMRQRAVESRLRAVGDALADELAVTLKQRTLYWKGRTLDHDKNEAKYVHKMRSKKNRPDEVSVGEQRELCRLLLLEQRSQFSFFVNALMPVLTAEVSLLEEGLHIRPVTDGLDATLRHVNADSLVRTILSDLTQGAENAWKTCLASAGVHSTGRASVNDGCPNDPDSSVQGRVPPAEKTRSAGPPPTQRVLPPSASSVPHYSSPSSAASSSSQMTPTTPSGAAPATSLSSFRSSMSSTPIYSAVLPSTLSDSSRIHRPQSFAGELRQTYATPTIFDSGMGDPETPSAYSVGLPSSMTDAASVIADTLQQIDHIGSELDSFCSSSAGSLPASATSGSSGSRGEYAALSERPAPVGAIRVRGGSYSRPPPPERRSSAITSATPAAPSVAEARLSLAASSLRGSRQSLASNHSASTNGLPSSNGSQSLPTPQSSFHPQATYRTQPSVCSSNPYAIPRPPHYS